MIGVLTFHRTTNYGAIFQTYALQQVLLNIGAETEIIDYRPRILEERYQPVTIFDWFSLKFLYNTFKYNTYIRDNRLSFYSFAEKYIKISRNVYDEDNIVNSNLTYDSFIVGSDQVWNPNCMGWDKNYLLAFVDGHPKNSYAASFGFDKWEDDTCNWLKSNINQFSKISVRESSGVELLKRMGISDVNVVLDPTLLISRKHWQGLINGDELKKPYILLYLLAETESIFTAARNLSKQTGLEVIYINDRLLPHREVINKFYTSPQSWLSLFNGASYVITNSFHGTAFSINFNIPFWVELLPPPSKVNARIQDLLVSTELSDRILKLSEEINPNVPDFQKANNYLSEMRVKSINYLKSLIIL